MSVHHLHNHECKAFHLDMISKQSCMSETRNENRKVSNLKQDSLTIEESGIKAMCDSNVDGTTESDMSDNPNICCNNDINLTTDELPADSGKHNLDDMFMYTNEMRVESNLLKLITDTNIPNYAFKKIME